MKNKNGFTLEEVRLIQATTELPICVHDVWIGPVRISTEYNYTKELPIYEVLNPNSGEEEQFASFREARKRVIELLDSFPS